MTRNTDGVTRTVYLLGGWAIKVPSLRYSWRLFLRGLLGNMTERDTWQWSAVADWEGVPRELLARVIWCCPGGWLLIMERADRTATDQEFLSIDPRAHRVSDLKPDNVGKFHFGGLKVIDYGQGWTVVEQEHERRTGV